MNGLEYFPPSLKISDVLIQLCNCWTSIITRISAIEKKQSQLGNIDNIQLWGLFQSPLHHFHFTAKDSSIVLTTWPKKQPSSAFLDRERVLYHYIFQIFIDINFLRNLKEPQIPRQRRLISAILGNTSVYSNLKRQEVVVISKVHTAGNPSLKKRSYTDPKILTDRRREDKSEILHKGSASLLWQF